MKERESVQSVKQRSKPKTEHRESVVCLPSKESKNLFARRKTKHNERQAKIVFSLRPLIRFLLSFFLRSFHQVCFWSNTQLLTLLFFFNRFVWFVLESLIWSNAWFHLGFFFLFLEFCSWNLWLVETMVGMWSIDVITVQQCCIFFVLFCAFWGILWKCECFERWVCLKVLYFN